MAKPKASEAYRISQFFQTAPLDTAEFAYGLVREIMLERRPMKTPGLKRRRGPNKPKVLGATAPHKPIDFLPSEEN